MRKIQIPRKIGGRTLREILSVPWQKQVERLLIDGKYKTPELPEKYEKIFRTDSLANAARKKNIIDDNYIYITTRIAGDYDILLDLSKEYTGQYREKLSEKIIEYATWLNTTLSYREIEKGIFTIDGKFYEGGAFFCYYGEYQEDLNTFYALKKKEDDKNKKQRKKILDSLNGED